MMQGQPNAWPAALDLRRNPLERPPRKRLVRFVLEISDASAHVVVAHQTKKRRHSAVDPNAVPLALGHRGHQRLERQRLRADRQKRRAHCFSIQGRLTWVTAGGSARR